MNAQRVRAVAAWCGACLIQSALADVTAAADSAQPLERAEGRGPAFEVSVEWCSRQLTYGLADNRDPIVVAGALAEWRGLTFEAAAIADTTRWGRKHGGYGNRQGTYQEFAFGPGLVHAWSPDVHPVLPTTVEAFVNTVYEYHPPVRKARGEENPDTQFVNAGVALPDLWLTPALSAELDVNNECGAVYLSAEVGHAFTLVRAARGCGADPLTLALGCGVGGGNPKRNRYDADFDAYALKDVWVSAALEWWLTDAFLVSPYVAVYEQAHGRLREAARHALEGETHASTQLVGGLRLALAF